MIYQSDQMEEQALLETAARMCTAARTAPKTMGKDNIVTLVLTGEEKNLLADKMDEIGKREFGEKADAWYGRDADNVRMAKAVVLIGIKRTYRGIKHCSFCGFEDCTVCKTSGGNCAFSYMDLGIAVSSAALAAAEGYVDNRVMFSVGKAAAEMAYLPDDILWHGIPLSAAGKNIFFDRKPNSPKKAV